MSDKELNSVIDRAEDEYQKLKDKVIEQDLEIERLNKELEEKEAILGGIQQLEAEIERLNNIIKEVRNWVKSTIDIIEQQPTGNDDWILERLNSFISLLDKGE